MSSLAEGLAVLRSPHPPCARKRRADEPVRALRCLGPGDEHPVRLHVPAPSVFATHLRAALDGEGVRVLRRPGVGLVLRRGKTDETPTRDEVNALVRERLDVLGPVPGAGRPYDDLRTFWAHDDFPGRRTRFVGDVVHALRVDAPRWTPPIGGPERAVGGRPRVHDAAESATEARTRRRAAARAAQVAGAEWSLHGWLTDDDAPEPGAEVMAVDLYDDATCYLRELDARLDDERDRAEVIAEARDFDRSTATRADLLGLLAEMDTGDVEELPPLAVPGRRVFGEAAEGFGFTPRRTRAGKAYTVPAPGAAAG